MRVHHAHTHLIRVNAPLSLTLRVLGFQYHHPGRPSFHVDRVCVRGLCHLDDRSVWSTPTGTAIFPRLSRMATVCERLHSAANNACP